MPPQEQTMQNLTMAIQQMNKNFANLFLNWMPSKDVDRYKPSENQENIGGIKQLLSKQNKILEKIEEHLRIPNVPLIKAKRVRYPPGHGSQDGWENLINVDKTIYTWRLKNESDDETIEISYSQNNEENAYIELSPGGEIFRDTRPGWIFGRRKAGNTGQPYPILVFELWKYSDKPREEI